MDGSSSDCCVRVLRSSMIICGLQEDMRRMDEWKEWMSGTEYKEFIKNHFNVDISRVTANNYLHLVIMF